MTAAGRLQGRSAFHRLRVSGVRLRYGSLSATVFFTDGPTRIGFALPTSLGNAVVRNRLRRRLRAITRSIDVNCLNADIVIRPSAACITQSHQTLATAFSQLMDKIAASHTPSSSS